MITIHLSLTSECSGEIEYNFNCRQNNEAESFNSARIVLPTAERQIATALQQYTGGQSVGADVHVQVMVYGAEHRYCYAIQSDCCFRYHLVDVHFHRGSSAYQKNIKTIPLKVCRKGGGDTSPECFGSASHHKRSLHCCTQQQNSSAGNVGRSYKQFGAAPPRSAHDFRYRNRTWCRSEPANNK